MIDVFGNGPRKVASLKSVVMYLGNKTLIYYLNYLSFIVTKTSLVVFDFK